MAQPALGAGKPFLSFSVVFGRTADIPFGIRVKAVGLVIKAEGILLRMKDGTDLLFVFEKERTVILPVRIP